MGRSISTAIDIHIGAITSKSDEGRINSGLHSEWINKERHSAGADLIEGSFEELWITLTISKLTGGFETIRTDVDIVSVVQGRNTVVANEVGIDLTISAEGDAANFHLITHRIEVDDRSQLGIGKVDEGRFIELKRSGNNLGVDEGIWERNVRQDTDDLLNLVDVRIAIEE